MFLTQLNEQALAQDNPTKQKANLRDTISSLAGDEATVLGRTNDMVQLLALTLSTLLTHIDCATTFDELKKKNKALVTSLADLDKRQNTTVALKGERLISQRFSQCNRSITNALTQSPKYQEKDHE